MYGVRIEGEGPRWIEDDEADVAVDIGDETAAECPDCGRYIDGPGDHDEDCDNREWTPEGPATWCNGAGVRIRDDEVQTWISLGDPRGAFTFSVRQLQDGRLIMHTPYPGETMPHMGLREIHPGTYEVGAYDPDAETISPDGETISQKDARALRAALLPLRTYVAQIEDEGELDEAKNQADDALGAVHTQIVP